MLGEECCGQAERQRERGEKILASAVGPRAKKPAYDRAAPAKAHPSTDKPVTYTRSWARIDMVFGVAPRAPS
jgi:hypothetical protein